MNGVMRDSGVRRIGFLAVLLLSAVSLKADPIAVGEGLPQLGVVIPIVFAVLAEAICVLLILWRWRRPRLFILWLMGMHLLTYPLFLGWLWLSYGLHPALGVAIGEAMIVFVEGGLIYLLCRFLASAKSESPVPSIFKSLFASLIGNICSAVAFPFLMIACNGIASWVAHSIAASGSD